MAIQDQAHNDHAGGASSIASGGNGREGSTKEYAAATASDPIVQDQKSSAQKLAAATARLLNDPANIFALAILEVDNLARIDEFYNAGTADALLAKIALRLESLIVEDAFAICDLDRKIYLLITDVESRDVLVARVTALIERLEQPYFVDGFEIFAGFTVGISALSQPDTGWNDMLRAAELALRSLRSNWQKGVAFFSHELDRNVSERMRTEQRLRRALRDCRFCCAFQPKVDIRSGEVKGVEALVRFVDEDGIIQAPSTFVALASELGVIDDLTRLVLDEISHKIDDLNDAFGPTSTISINVAANQATNVRFMQGFVKSLMSARMPERFIVEITEDAFLRLDILRADVLPLLRAHGIGISIDDFGTGYSSLAALCDVPADEVKIDRAFIKNIHEKPKSQAVLRSIDRLCHDLGMTVVAEGVEMEAELNFIRDETSIQLVQGFYYAKPLFFDDLTTLKQSRLLSRGGSIARERMIGRAPLTGRC